MDENLITSVINSAAAAACAFALKDVLLETKEQKELYNERHKFYFDKFMNGIKSDIANHKDAAALFDKIQKGIRY